MILLGSRRVPVVAALEYAFAALVLAGAASLAYFELSASLNAVLQAPAAVVAAAYTGVQLVCIGVFGLYRLDRARSWTEFLGCLAGSLAAGGGLSFLALTVWGKAHAYGAFLPTALLLSAAGLVAVRGTMMAGVRFGLGNHRILVLGTGPEAYSVERCLRHHGPSGVVFAGFFPAGQGTPQTVDSEHVVKGFTSLEQCVREFGINEIVVAVREQRGGQLPIAELVSARLVGVRVTALSDFFERVTGEVPLDSLKASWIIYGYGFRQNVARRVVKRLFDIASSLLLLVISAPIMALAALAIALESRGPVLFRQERVGLAGRTFQILKFRSMRTDAERDGIPRWANTNDPRVTRVGKLIRKTRIDELPQLFNVLKGEMSLVGPRPERPYFVNQLTEEIPFYSVRHSVKPGVTGWAQTQYAYGASVEDAVRKLQFDLYYVKNHTVALDAVILLQTIRIVLFGEGAR